MKIAKIRYLQCKEKDKRLWRKRLNELAGNLKGNTKLEVLVIGKMAELRPLKKRITVIIDSEHVAPCITYANPKYVIIDDLTNYFRKDTCIKVYYDPKLK